MADPTPKATVVFHEPIVVTEGDTVTITTQWPGSSAAHDREFLVATFNSLVDLVTELVRVADRDPHRHQAFRLIGIAAELEIARQRFEGMT